MSVPEDIRKVPRPKNTVVVKSGSGYRVRVRIGCRYVNGRRVPVDGGYIGSIINGRYVPDEPVGKTGSTGRVDIKAYGRVKLCDLLNSDVLAMLAPFYNSEESRMIYCMAVLQTCYPGVRDYQMERRYDESFLSEMYPFVPMGKNDVCTEQRNLGLEYCRIREFMRARVCTLAPDDTLIIDGCLRQNHSVADTFSKPSRKTHLRRHKDTLMLYAYSAGRREPVCSKIYQGNTVDSRAVSDFLKSNQITRGVIVADKGFPYQAMSEAIGGNKDLHYLLPLKRDSLLITENDMYSFDGKFNTDGPVECRKVRCQGFYLYSFRDLALARGEEEEYLSEHGDSVPAEELAARRPEFGTIVFRSDLDLEPARAYSMYEDRWLIELLFKFFQSGLDMDDTRVHDDYSDIGSEFVDFLSALMGSRMLNYLRGVEEMKGWTFKTCMDFLEGLKMVRVDESGGWENNRIALTDAELFERIGLLSRPVVPVEVKRRGRPKGRRDSRPRKRRAGKAGDQTGDGA